ncbi:restriction endonuclease subunit S [Solitalea sp. MAHUQ-68]|uniref:Restriction endonuclease subunit S n=1 Tax=Solitalea agri TaxID=2953739 RepID=A0A9X2F5U3_9SPHI|nr:restriction endonuclease subunit S [Solitalea agri]MCO4291358.1 restriction endonuclease subunit S [Solitalea agri]
MSVWVKTKLGDIISIKGGFSYKGEFIGKGSTLLLGMGCVSFSDIFLHSGARLYEGDTPDSFLVKPQDIVLATRQQSDNLPILGAPAFVPKFLDGKRVIVGTNLYKIENDSTVNNEFLFWLLRTEDYRNHINSCSKGSTVKMITKDAVESYEFLCPSEEERNNIATILWKINDKIDLLHRQNATLEKMAETLFRQWFVEEAKEEWEMGILGDFGKVITGKTPSKENPNYWGDKYHFVTPTDFKDFGMFTNQPTRGLSEVGWSKLKSLQLPQDSILVTCIGSDMGKVTISSQPCITNQQLNSIIIRDKKYIGYVFEHIKSQYQNIRNIAFGGTTMPIINKNDFQNINTPIPSNDIVELFNIHWEVYANKILKNQTQIRTLTALRDTLLPKLMSGEVGVDLNKQN